MLYLSTMLDTKIEDKDGGRLGRLEDVVAVPGAKFPVVKGIMVRSRSRRDRRLFFIPWTNVKDWKPDRMVIEEPSEEVRPDRGDLFLVRDLLDKQIVDMDGYKIVRVSDIKMARSGGELRVVGADVGLLAILRRLGLSSLAERLGSERRGISGDRTVSWNLVSPVGPMPHDVRLRVPYQKFLEIHPSDMADIIEQLDLDQRAKIMALIEDPKAAEVLKHIIPGVRPSVAEAMGDERLSDLLEIMPPDEAADILGSLPRGKAQMLLSLMGINEAFVVRELLGYDPDTAGGRMTTEFVVIPDSLTARETIEYLRERGPEAETIYYVYVTDREVHLSGVLSLRDLLRSAPDEVVVRIMMRDVITAELEDDQEIVADKLSRYNLLALPVVDEDHILKGIVTVDDVIDVIREETSEDLSQISGVPFQENMVPIRDSRRWAGTMLTFLGGIGGTALFGIFRTEFVAAIALVYFVPLALRSAHDVSTWSLAVAVRDLREVDIGAASVKKILAREYLYTLVTALLISVLGFAAGMVWTKSRGPALAGGAGLFVGVALAGMLGLVVPLVIRRVFPDATEAPGRLVAVMVMAASILSFLVVSGLLVKAWG